MWLQIVFLLSGASLLANGDLIPFEPVQYIKSHVMPVNSSSVWSLLQEASPQEVGEISRSLKTKFNDLLHGSGTNVVFAKGDRVIRKFLSSKSAMDQKNKLPYANVIAVVSTSMTILLESFQHEVVSEPIGKVLKGEDLSAPIAKAYKSHSFLDILNLLSTGNSDTSLPALMKDLERSGMVAMHFLDAILGSTAKEAWMDALLAYNIENYVKDDDQLVVSLHNIFQYLLTVNHDFRILHKSTKLYADLQEERYMFGWWLNCPRTTDSCMFPDLPDDLIFSVSGTLRMYVSPSFDLSLIVSDPHSQATFDDIIRFDGNIWKQIYSVLNPNVDSSSVSEGEAPSPATNSTDKLTELVYQVWPVLLFMFWVVSSHVWVYWMFHCCWLVATKISKRTHIQRPKLASSNTNN